MADTTKYVYFICGGGMTKVGTSVDPEWRLQCMQTGNPETLRLVAKVPGDHRLERQVGMVLRQRHYRGEWYAGEMVEEEVIMVVDDARSAPDAVSAFDQPWGSRPVCECHGEKMYWSRDHRRRGGGYWRCRVLLSTNRGSRAGQPLLAHN